MRFHLSFGLSVAQLDISVIDENKYLPTVLETILSAFEVSRIRSFANARECLSALEEDAGNFLVVGSVKGTDGPCGLIRELRKEEMDPVCYLPVVVCSQKISAANKQALAHAGATKVISRRFTPTSLYETIREICSDRRRLYLDDGVYLVEESASSTER